MFEKWIGPASGNVVADFTVSVDVVFQTFFFLLRHPPKPSQMDGRKLIAEKENSREEKRGKSLVIQLFLISFC